MFYFQNQHVSIPGSDKENCRLPLEKTRTTAECDLQWFGFSLIVWLIFLVPLSEKLFQAVLTMVDCTPALIITVIQGKAMFQLQSDVAVVVFYKKIQSISYVLPFDFEVFLYVDRYTSDNNKS